MEDLATLISEAMTAKDMSLRDVEQASERHGHKVSYSTVSKITKGHYKPGERILVALSVTLDLPIQKLREAAGQSEPGTPFKLPSYASRLSPAERSAVEHIVRVMVEAKDERKVAGHDNQTPNTQAGDDPPADPTQYGLAAFKGLPGEDVGETHVSD